jgi:hypothetical protein
MRITRRTLLLSAATALISSRSPVRSGPARNGTIPGAIRWDAWYGTSPGSAESFVNGYVDQTLGPQRFQNRAPWFAKPVSTSLLSINGNMQPVIDAEITYASHAGLKYWAYCWYGAPQSGSPMQNAWALHQTSRIKDLMNWCMLLQFSRIGPEAVFDAAIPTWVSYMQQPNYQKVMSGRPLLYLFVDGLLPLTTSWNSSWGNVRVAFNALSKECIAHGLKAPYLVIMHGPPTVAVKILSQILGDAISSYTVGRSSVDQIRSYSTSDTMVGNYQPFEASVEADWASRAAVGAPIVPTCMTNWDTRPRRGAVLAPGSVNKPHFREDVYITAPTPAQLTTQLQHCVSFIGQNPISCESKALIIYSWDECDEGGSALIPARGKGLKPDTTYLDATEAVTF